MPPMRLLHALEWLLLPGSCVFCGLPSRRAMDLCECCEADLPWIRHACRRCALPLPETAPQLCGQCLGRSEPFELTVAPFRYAAPLPQMIHQFKYRGRMVSGRVLATLLARALESRYANAPLPDVIVPVPLAWPRLMWRGYNQAGLLARWIAGELDRAVAHDLVRRKRGPPPQTGLSAHARMRNLKGAFSLGRNNVPRSVAIVDDVMTTGSTFRELARVLVEGGAEVVHCWAIARTDTLT
jgi:ComF family protein